MASKAGNLSQPSMNDLMSCLKNIEGKLSTMDKRLDALEEVKHKVDRFDTEIKKLWLALEYNNKKVTDRVTVVEGTDFGLSLLSRK